MVVAKYITASCIIANNTVYKNGVHIFAEHNKTGLTQFLLNIYQHFNINYPKFYKMDNLSKSGWLASEMLLKDEGVGAGYKPEETGIVMMNANASLDTDLNYYETVGDMPSPALFVYTLPNIMTGEICIRNNFKGENAFFVSDEFDAGLIYLYVNNLFNNGIVNACICGWVDVLVDEYKTVLFLIEKEKRGVGMLFTKENMEKIFHGYFK